MAKNLQDTTQIVFQKRDFYNGQNREKNTKKRKIFLHDSAFLLKEKTNKISKEKSFYWSCTYGVKLLVPFYYSYSCYYSLLFIIFIILQIGE